MSGHTTYDESLCLPILHSRSTFESRVKVLTVKWGGAVERNLVLSDWMPLAMAL